MKNNIFPSNSELEKAILESLKLLEGTGTTSQINEKVIEILNLSEEIVLMEDENGIDTKLNYRLRWSRTNLKQHKKIRNIKRGVWTLEE